MYQEKLNYYYLKIAEVLYLFSFTITIVSLKFLELNNSFYNYFIILFLFIFVIVKFSIEENYPSHKIIIYMILLQSQNLFFSSLYTKESLIFIFLILFGVMIYTVLMRDSFTKKIHYIVIVVISSLLIISKNPNSLIYILSLPFVIIIAINFEKTNKITFNIINELSTTDDLTGLLNQSGFMKKIEEEFYRSQRYNKTFSVLMLDSDNLKHVNDTYGHKYGSMVITSIAEVIKSNIRRTDFAARYGGDEFIICLVETEIEGAKEVAERIRKQFELKSFFTKDEKKFNLTVSIGISNYPLSGDSLLDIIDNADKALYESKKQGKNKTTLMIKN
ncbi:MAG: GGDEF domain-containing protein [Calditerrivibrio sp.]|nr:GGDEF domain-containing protein [Calditerrivibrio sp.]